MDFMTRRKKKSGSVGTTVKCLSCWRFRMTKWSENQDCRDHFHPPPPYISTQWDKEVSSIRISAFWAVAKTHHLYSFSPSMSCWSVQCCFGRVQFGLSAAKGSLTLFVSGMINCRLFSPLPKSQRRNLSKPSFTAAAAAMSSTSAQPFINITPWHLFSAGGKVFSHLTAFITPPPGSLHPLPPPPLVIPLTIQKKLHGLKKKKSPPFPGSPTPPPALE